jgi:hypothetical protein
LARLKYKNEAGDWVSIEDQGSVYIHTYNSGTNIHNFAGSGIFGIALITAAFTAGDTFTINGVAATLDNANDISVNMANGSWMLFIIVGTKITFVQKFVGLVTAPVSASSVGTSGNIAADANYIYVCYATDTWVRCAKTAW